MRSISAASAVVIVVLSGKTAAFAAPAAVAAPRARPRTGCTCADAGFEPVKAKAAKACAPACFLRWAGARLPLPLPVAVAARASIQRKFGSPTRMPAGKLRLRFALAEAHLLQASGDAATCF